MSKKKKNKDGQSTKGQVASATKSMLDQLQEMTIGYVVVTKYSHFSPFSNIRPVGNKGLEKWRGWICGDKSGARQGWKFEEPLVCVVDDEEALHQLFLCSAAKEANETTHLGKPYMTYHGEAITWFIVDGSHRSSILFTLEKENSPFKPPKVMLRILSKDQLKGRMAVIAGQHFCFVVFGLFIGYLYHLYFLL